MSTNNNPKRNRRKRGPWLILALMLLLITILNVFLSSQAVVVREGGGNNHNYDNDDSSDSVEETILTTTTTTTNTTTTTLMRHTTTINNNNNNNNTIFHCKRDDKNGFGEIRSIFKSVLPEYQFILADFQYDSERKYWIQNCITKENRNLPQDLFILIIGVQSCNQQVMSWLIDEFYGTIVYISGENIEKSDNNNYLSRMSNMDHKFILGPIQETNNNNRSLTLTYLQMTWWKIFRPIYTQKVLVDITFKPHNNQQRFLIYAASNCIDYREKAFIEISQIIIGGLLDDVVLHYGGKCNGSGSLNQQQKQKQRGGNNNSNMMSSSNNDNNNNSTRIVYAKNFISIKNWSKNVEFYSNYKFCLVMEHIYDLYYVTEKIMMAFLGGCIPIYYGSTMVYDIFNPKAFIYYDVANPIQSLDLIRYLQTNQTAYNEMLYKQPILLEGHKTIEKYFSFSDDVGSGYMKQKIRSKLLLPSSS